MIDDIETRADKLRYGIRLWSLLLGVIFAFLVWENIAALLHIDAIEFSQKFIIPEKILGLILAGIFGLIIFKASENIIDLMKYHFNQSVSDGLKTYFADSRGPYETFVSVQKEITNIDGFIQSLSTSLRERVAGPPTPKLINQMINEYLSELKQQRFVVSFATYIDFLVVGVRESKQLRAINLTPPWEWWLPVRYDVSFQKSLGEYVNALKRVRTEAVVLKRINVFNEAPTGGRDIFYNFISETLSYLGDNQSSNLPIKKSSLWIYRLLSEIGEDKLFSTLIPTSDEDFQRFERSAREGILGISEKKSGKTKISAYHISAKYLKKFSDELHKQSADCIYCYMKDVKSPAFPVESILAELLLYDSVIFDGTVVRLASPIGSYVCVDIKHDENAANNFDKLYNQLMSVNGINKGTMAELSESLKSEGDRLLADDAH